MSTWGVSTGHSNILAHDLTPVDNAVSHVSPHNAYEPSTGAPRRAFGRSQGFTRGGVADSQAPVSVARSRHEAVRKVGITQPAHPGHADSAAGFFGGQHSTQYHKNSDTRGVASRFVDPEIHREQQRIDAAQRQEFGRIAQHQQRELRAKREQERDYESKANLAHVQAEQPWGRAGAGTPKVAINGGRLAISTDVAKGGVFNQGGHDSYVGINMGKHGSGAPMKQADGSIKTRTAHIMSKYQHHTQGPEDAWTAQNMGKIAPGAGPRVSDDGQIFARKHNVVGAHKMHEDAVQPTYSDQIFGKPGVGVRPDGQEKMGRNFNVSKHRIHKDGHSDHHLPGFSGSYPQRTDPTRVTFDRQLQMQQQTSAQDPINDGFGKGGGPARTASGRVNARHISHTADREEFSSRYGVKVTDRGYREPPPRSTYQYKPPKHHQQQEQQQQQQQQQQQEQQADVPFTSPLQDAASARSRRAPSASEFVVDQGGPSKNGSMFEGGQPQGSFD